MAVETDYEPKYVDDLSDVPISGPDDYTAGDKRKALFHAESELEVDVNEGAEISPESVKNIHKTAVMNLATHVLTHAAEDPSSVTLGDMEDGGGTITQYSSTYKDTYDALVDKIISSGVSDSRSRNFAVAVNNGTVGDDATTSSTT